MIAIDSKGRIAGGTSTNGANHKVPGYVLHSVDCVLRSSVELQT